MSENYFELKLNSKVSFKSEKKVNETMNTYQSTSSEQWVVEKMERMRAG